MSPDPRVAAWSRYWSEGGARSAGGCLPNAEAGIDGVLTETWHRFARSIPRRGRVLDLATGDGIVLAKLHAVRPDLKLVGMDSSPVLPPPPRGAKLKPDVRMERLPSERHSFEAVTSQFGIEYGDIAAIAPEIVRVLRPGGRACFVIHHRDGPVVKHNLARRDALQWAVSKSGLLDKASALARARLAMQIPTPPAFSAGLSEARQRFPSQPVAEEFALGIVQVLDQRAFPTPQAAVAALADLRDRANGEIARIDALASAACDADAIAGATEQLSRHGLRIDCVETLDDRRGQPPFAWLILASAPGR